MGKIRDLLDQSENQRLEFYKDNDGNVHQINRIPEEGLDGGGHGHRRVIHKSDGTKEAEDFISKEEYENIKSSFKRVDANEVGK